MAGDDLDPMDAIKQTFFQECEEGLADLESGLMAMESGTGGPDTVNAVFRAVHSMKGGAGAFGLTPLVRFAHVFESTLDRVRSDQLAPEPPVLRVLLRAADCLQDLVRAAQSGTGGNPARVDAVAAELAALDGNGAAAADADAADGGDDFADFGFTVVPFQADTPAEAMWQIRLRPHAALYAKANDVSLLLRELGRLGAMEVRLDTDTLPPLASLDPEGAYLAWTVDLYTAESEAAIREVFEFVDGDCDLLVQRADAPSPAPLETSSPTEPDVMELLRRIQADAQEMAGPAVPPPAPAASAAPPSAALAAAPAAADPHPAGLKAAEAGPAAKPTIRVDLERVDRLIDLVGELVINQAMLAQRVGELGAPRSSGVSTGLDDLGALTRGIQEAVMAIRAQPVKSVFQRMPRLTREVAAMTGKQVRLVTEGEGTEVDRTVIEHLADPLTHMLRNAIDHGVERPEVRAAAGKPAEGVVRLAAMHRGGRIVIEVSDDGAGINRNRVRASAVAKGLITADAALSDDEVDNLIFLPGFSTAETISDISGRGVGMDVVRRQVLGLGGRISIASKPGQGSCFTLSLPLTLAVLDGMVVLVAGHTMIVPLTAIIETLQPKRGDVHGFGDQPTDAARVVAIRGTWVPLVDVAVALGFRAAPLDEPGAVALLVEGEGGRRAALLVDAILGQRQVVIKSLEANYRPVPGVAAATILGDGRVALILDVDAVAAGPVPHPATAGAAYA
ncbi:MAG TPA: chemotaxis protein CheA [Acetobacteraceae bacterium]